MQCLFLPIATLHSIDETISHFLWTGTPNTSKVHLVKWTNIIKSKRKGGLGIKGNRHLNAAFMARLCWNTFYARTSPTSAVTHSKYISNRASPRPFSKSSHIWQSMEKGWQALQSSMTWSIDNGTSINLWNENLTSLGPIRQLIHGPLTQASLSANVKHIITYEQWSFDTFLFILPPSISTTILSIPLPTLA